MYNCTYARIQRGELNCYLSKHMQENSRNFSQFVCGGRGVGVGRGAHRVYVLIFQSLHNFYAYDAHMQHLCIVANFYESCSICRDGLLINITAVN